MKSVVYPRVYFQLRKMLKFCKQYQGVVADKAYCDALIEELTLACKALEMEAKNKAAILEDTVILDDLEILRR